MIIKETTKLEYLKGIQNKNIFQNNENNKKINKEYLEKEIKVFHKIKLINTGNFLGEETKKDYILQELLNEGFIKENLNNKDINPNNYFKLTPKGELYIERHKGILGKINLYIAYDYSFIGALIIGISGGIIGIIGTILFQK